MTYTTEELEKYREFEDDHDYRDAKNLAREVKDEVKDISDDLTPEDFATLSYLMNTQTNHERDHRASIGEIYKAEVHEYDDYRKLEVHALHIYGALEIERPDQDGQFGTWDIESVRSSSDKHAGIRTKARLKYRDGLVIELVMKDPERFLLHNGERIEEED